MAKLPVQVSSKNPIVFFDINIDQEFAGRMIIELRKDVVPKTAENFRCLCTGERGIGEMGKPLHYKGNRFHKVTRVYVVQGGDVVNNDGTSGDSIYGPIFNDENFLLNHDEEGAVSMANYGQPNSNNSQFIITSVVCEILNGTNVVVGKVLRGLGIIADMEINTNDKGEPTQEIVIANCGEIPPGVDWNFRDKDGADTWPPYPQDWEGKFKTQTLKEVLNMLTVMRNAGNDYFKRKKYWDARRKYRKATRYYNYFRKNAKWKEPGYEDISNLDDLDAFYAINSVNMAAVELKVGKYDNVRHYCSETLRYDPNNRKAYFRRGQANIQLKNYEEAVEDFNKAHSIVPGDKSIIKELNRAKKFRAQYNKTQQEALKNLFK